MSKLMSKLMMVIAVIGIIGTIGVPEFVERCNQRGQEAVVKAALNTFYRDVMTCFASLEGTLDSYGNPISQAYCWADEFSDACEGYPSACGVHLRHPNVASRPYAGFVYVFPSGNVVSNFCDYSNTYFWHIGDPDTHYWLNPDGSIVTNEADIFH